MEHFRREPVELRDREDLEAASSGIRQEAVERGRRSFAPETPWSTNSSTAVCLRASRYPRRAKS
jgi:hypothetical protein